jgi:molybdenum cofactor cytidylyltransferase
MIVMGIFFTKKISMVKNKIEQFGIIILAAGQSSRLGSPKQLLEFDGRKLIVGAVETATYFSLYPVIVVLGAHAEIIKSYLDMPSIKLVQNENWNKGVSSSIKKGVEEMELNYPHVDGLILMVCDQPYLDHITIQKLIDLQRQTDLVAVACEYDGIPGTPALFHKSLFGELSILEGDKGARKLFESMKDKVARLPFSAGAIDIDTQEDYLKLIKGN